MQRLLILGVVLSWGLAAAAPLGACPSCSQAVAAAAKLESDRDENAPAIDPLGEARGYNYSIYLMLGMPYLLFASLGLLMYRSIKSAQKQAAQEGDMTPPESEES
ncbi:MAG: hypothetical protein ACK4RK_14720 [Gemmataceae bacterium]